MIIKKIDKGKLVLVSIAALLLFFEVYRILNFCITWDEGLTYNDFVRPIFRGAEYGIVHQVKEYFFSPSWCSANNHWLNTVLIGVLDRITGIEYNEYIIRLPIFCFFVIYLAGILFAYSRQYISFAEAYMLMLCYYVDEFFVLARGYAFALTLIFIGIYGMKKWRMTGERKHLLWAIISLTLAEVANTIALLPVAALFLVILILLVKSKLLLDFIRRYWMWLSSLAMINFLMIMYHFKAASADGSLYYNKDGSIWSILLEYIGFLFPRFAQKLLPIYIVIATVSISMVWYNKDKRGSFCFTTAWFLYLFITYVGIKVCDEGFPTGRELIPAYALFIVSLQEMFNVIGCNLKNKIQHTFAIIGCILLGISFVNQLDLEGTRDWGNYANVKKEAYHIWKTQEKVDRTEKQYKSEGMQFYRDKILLEYGYDIFMEE